jgi:hypothetical protein
MNRATETTKMPHQDTSTSTSTSSPELPALLARLRALDSEVVEAIRALRFGLDDLGAALESGRQVRAQLGALVARDGVR